MNFGIDLGSWRVVIYDPARGVVLDEPSVIAVCSRTGKVIACGEEAQRMLGRTPPSIHHEPGAGHLPHTSVSTGAAAAGCVGA